MTRTAEPFLIAENLTQIVLEVGERGRTNNLMADSFGDDGIDVNTQPG
jgi:hypothetical protein